MNGYKKKTKMDEIHELGIQLRDEQLQNTHLAQKCSDLADEITRKDFTLKAQAYEIQEAYEKINALEDDLHNSETEKDTLKRVNESLEKSVKIWEVSHNEQRKTFIKFLEHVEQMFQSQQIMERNPIQYNPGPRAEIENMINHYSK